jgi:hypothetical protein
MKNSDLSPVTRKQEAQGNADCSVHLPARRGPAEGKAGQQEPHVPPAGSPEGDKSQTRAWPEADACHPSCDVFTLKHFKMGNAFKFVPKAEEIY